MGLQDELVASFRWVDGHADIWPWFADATLFAGIVQALAEPFKKDHVTKVLGVEARGFLLAGAVARELKAGVAPVRKHGAIFPGPHLSVKTSPDYRGRSIDLLVQTGSLSDKDRVLLVDDWLETGSQLLAAVDLVHRTGAHLIGAAVIVDQSDGPPITPLHSLVRGAALGSSS